MKNYFSLNLTELICYYTQVYGAQFVILACLVPFTIFRRQISCNHVYHDDNSSDCSCGNSDENESVVIEEENDMDSDDPISLSSSSTSASFSKTSILDKLEADLLLQRVGMLTPAPLIAALWRMLQLLNDTVESAHGATSAEEMLERDWCILEPLLTVILFAFAKIKNKPTAAIDRELQMESTQRKNNNTPNTKYVIQDEYNPPFSQEIPPDALVQIISYLPPRDVMSFVCVNRSCRTLVENGETSSALWKCLWERDYAWIIHSWEIGQQAYKRSLSSMSSKSRSCSLSSLSASPPSSSSSKSLPRSSSFSLRFGKDFYFNFGQAYMNYVLAGCNNTDKCLVGLHGSVYDITDFLPKHPGSPETLLVVAGGDATSFFEDVMHTSSARRLAKTLCVVANCSHAHSQESHGLFPTENTVLLPNGDSNRYVSPVVGSEAINLSRQQHKVSGTLHRTRTNFLDQQFNHEKRFSRKLSSLRSSIVGSIRTYYDPFCSEWKVWYTNSNFQPVFVD